MSNVVWLMIATALMLPGFVGLLVPVIPGIPYMFIVALLYGFIDRFTVLTTSELSILFIIALVSVAVDYLAGTLGAKYSGASAKALAAGIIGMVVGLIIFPPFGSFIGLFAGVLLTELKFKTQAEAMKAATGSLLGSVAGIAVNFILALIFLALFLVFGWR